MAKKILVVTKDMGGYQVLTQPAALLSKEGFVVTIVAEGLSIRRWQKEAGFEVYGGVPAEGQFDPKTLMRRDIDPADLIEKIKPDVVMASLGSPINLERDICLIANSRSIPVVFVEDIWGCHQRANDVVPDLVCTLDCVGVQMIERYYHDKPIIVETGSPAFDVFATGSVPSHPLLHTLTAGFARTVYILGQDESTTPYLEGVIKAVNEDPFNTLLIVGLHPKFLGDPVLCKIWLDSVKKAKVPILWVNSMATTHQYMLYSDVVVACYSTGLVEAALLGCVSVSWTSEVGRNKMTESLGGLTRYPTVEYGATSEVSSPEEFISKIYPLISDVSVAETQIASDIPTAIALRDRLHVDGKSAERIARSVRDFI